MPELGWLTRALADVPPHDRWLAEREREVLATLRIPKRRADWRLGRWAAKEAVAESQGVDIVNVEILATAGGAPQALVGGTPIPPQLSLSHRAGRALVAVGNASGTLGCDLEAIEARSPAFVREWLRPRERELIESLDDGLRDLAANLVWSAKEAAAKARGEGLRLNVRHATVSFERAARSREAWAELRIAWEDESVDRGWWRHEPGWVMTVVGDPADTPPRELP